MGLNSFFNKIGKGFSTVANTGKKYLGKGLGIFNQSRTFGKNLLKDPLVANLYDFAKSEFPALEGVESFLGTAGDTANYIGKLVGAENAEISERDSRALEHKIGGYGDNLIDRAGIKRKDGFNLSEYIRKKRTKYSK